MAQMQMAEGGQVLAFQAANLRSRRPRTRDDGERGTVLLFTGVRYSRLTDEPAAAEIAESERMPDGETH
ncbi:MAG: hypothetical protein JO048_05685 [Methylobacteriaceae bacterium]|nr:hypothetical protein [Methylobacteriaceae bacterium]